MAEGKRPKKTSRTTFQSNTEPAPSTSTSTPTSSTTDTTSSTDTTTNTITTTTTTTANDTTTATNTATAPDTTTAVNTTAADDTTTFGTTYPFAGQKLYVDPYTQAAQYVNSGSSAYPVDVMKRISDRPTAAWFGDWNANVYADVFDLVSRAKSQGAMPVIVAYNIPNRDCGSYSSGGTTASAYPAWIEQIALAIGNAKAAVILEPDALPQINQPGCLSDYDKGVRYQLIKNAISSFKKHAPNTAVYLDAGNPHWIPAPTMAQNLTNAGISTADGFALNVSNFFTTESNVSYGTQISGMVGNKRFVIDTSRNGFGPTADYQWCNPSGRALGAPPQGFSSGLVDAYLWIKKPGESDGTCNGGPSAGVFWPQYAYDLASRAQ